MGVDRSSFFKVLDENLPVPDATLEELSVLFVPVCEYIETTYSVQDMCVINIIGPRGLHFEFTSKGLHYVLIIQTQNHFDWYLHSSILCAAVENICKIDPTYYSESTFRGDDGTVVTTYMQLFPVPTGTGYIAVVSQI